MCPLEHYLGLLLEPIPTFLHPLLVQNLWELICYEECSPIDIVICCGVCSLVVSFPLNFASLPSSPRLCSFTHYFCCVLVFMLQVEGVWTRMRITRILVESSPHSSSIEGIFSTPSARQCRMLYCMLLFFVHFGIPACFPNYF